MKSYRLFLFLLILGTGLVVAGSPMAFFDPDPEPEGYRHGPSAVYLGYGFLVPPHTFYKSHSLLHHRETLKLNPDQIQAIERAALDYQQFYLMHSAKIKIQELELLHLLKEDAPDRSHVRNEMEKLGQMKVDLVTRYFRHLLEIRNLLTTKQLKMMQQLN
jgi:Spy/CpxP family protein refolding chaperone